MARPGVVIGRGGSTLKSLQEELENMIEVSKGGNKGKRIGLDVWLRVENAEQEAAVVAQRIADQLVREVPFPCGQFLRPWIKSVRVRGAEV